MSLTLFAQVRARDRDIPVASGLVREAELSTLIATAVLPDSSHDNAGFRLG